MNRFKFNGNEFVVDFSRDRENSRRTNCVILYGSIGSRDGEKNVLTYGSATRHPRDPENAVIGRTLALKNAVSRVEDRSLRTTIFESTKIRKQWA